MPQFKWIIIFSVIVFSVFAQVNAQENTVLVLGDSVSAAYGIPVARGWTRLLEEKLKTEKLSWQVINASVSGATTDNGLRQLPSLLGKYKPSIVLIQLGGNDGLRGVPFVETATNLQKMVKLSLEAGAQPILVEVDLPPNYGKPYRERFRKIYTNLAAEYSLPMASFVVNNLIKRKQLIQNDGLHPNEAAQPLLLQAVWDVLAHEISGESID